MICTANRFAKGSGVYTCRCCERRTRDTGGLDFSKVRVGRMFHLNGNDYVKQSTRTARMLSNGRVFYIGQREIVHLVAC